MTRRFILGLSTVIAGLPAVGGVPAAQAQQSAQAPAALEEIVVTARKREESLTEVPLSISAFSEGFLEQKGIDSIVDLANQTPGFSFRSGFGRVGSGQGGSASSRPAIRGQSNILGVPNAGFFVDGVYVSGNIASYQLDNVERIEVIRGPQAALFGRGTFAGAVNFITRKPGDEIGGKIEVQAGQYDRWEANGYVSGPLVADRVGFEVNARYYEFGGDWFNRAVGERNGGDESSRNIGGKLYFTPSDNFTLEVNGGYSKDLDGYFAGGYSGINCQLPTIVATVPFPRSSNRRTGYFCGEVETQRTWYGRTDVLEAFNADGVDRRSYRGSAKATYDVNEWTLTGIAAYNKYSNENSFDSSFSQSEVSLRPTGFSTGQDRRRDWSVEARIESPVDRTVHGLAGVYYYREDDGSGNQGAFTLGAGQIPIRGTVDDRGIVPYGQAAPMLPAVPAGVIRLLRTATQNDSAVRNWSVFGLLEFEINEDIRLTAEGRYQSDRITSDQAVANPNNVLLNATFKKFLPRATASYALNEDWNVYANVAKGNKPGGFNGLPVDADAASIAALRANNQTFKEESAWTYELGVKGNTEDRTLGFNGSGYWIDWTDQQLTKSEIYIRQNGTANTAALIQNAGESRVRGLELEVNARPTDEFDVRVAWAYVDAKIRNFLDDEQEDLYDTDGRVGALNTGNDPTGQARGQRLPQVPAHQLIVGAGYTRPIQGDWEGFLRGDMTYEGKRFSQVDNLAHTGDSYIANFRVGAQTEDLTLTFFVNNAFDDRTPTVLTRLRDFARLLQIPNRLNPALTQTTFFRDIQVGYPRKRAWGLSANYKF
ncbi:MAG: TonB-dependent receptor [Alphaproteobacteria bacterium]|nr:TonB-dependent receptor [Alphaproteobacteria bacterium]